MIRAVILSNDKINKEKLKRKKIIWADSIGLQPKLWTRHLIFVLLLVTFSKADNLALPELSTLPATKVQSTSAEVIFIIMCFGSK